MGTVLLRPPLRSHFGSLSVSVPFSMGTVLLRSFVMAHAPTFCVSVPFSMGTVLLLRVAPTPEEPFACFSPLLDGDGVASGRQCCKQERRTPFQSPSRWGRCCFSVKIVGAIAAPGVSVPFSMGTVLLPRIPLDLSHGPYPFQSPSRWGRCCFLIIIQVAPGFRGFQSPSRWGRCCFGENQMRSRPAFSRPFQSPSRWGRCCFAAARPRWRSRRHSFQSPSRWGRCCFEGQDIESLRGGRVSVPFSMGTVLLLTSAAGRSSARLRFSPLLDGDGVASPRRTWHGLRLRRFQSPSRWGRCCFDAREACDVRFTQFQSPSRWGRCCF